MKKSNRKKISNISNKNRNSVKRKDSRIAKNQLESRKANNLNKIKIRNMNTIKKKVSFSKRLKSIVLELKENIKLLYLAYKKSNQEQELNENHNLEDKSNKKIMRLLSISKIYKDSKKLDYEKEKLNIRLRENSKYINIYTQDKNKVEQNRKLAIEHLQKAVSIKISIIEKTFIISFIILLILVLSMVITTQVKTVNLADLKKLEILKEQELDDELSSIKVKKSNIEKEISKKSDLLSKYNNIIENKETSENIYEYELKNTNKLIGKEEVQGDGIIISLNNDINMIDTNDILNVINELKSFGVEYISVNDYRVTPQTYFSLVRSREMLIDGNRINAPYEIKAICNFNLIDNNFKLKNGIFDSIILSKKKINIIKGSNLTIKKIEKGVSLKYGN